MKPIAVERAPRSVGRYDSSAQAAIRSELEARKREAGTTFCSGNTLREQGHAFFEADRDYYLRPVEGKPLVEVSAFSKYDEDLLDFDGRTEKVCYYDWWYLDAQLRPIPGFRAPFCDSLSDRNIFKARFEALQDQAVQALGDRGR